MATKRRWGYRRRDYARQPLGSVRGCCAYRGPVFSDEELADRIRSLDITADLLSRVRERNRGWREQNSTNFCWMHALAGLMEGTAIKQGHEPERLSAAAGACRVFNYRNKGGNSFDAIPFVAENGLPSVDLWRESKIPSRRERDHYESDAVWGPAKANRLTQWFELEPNNFRQLLSLMVLGVPAWVGVWWPGGGAHAVQAYRPLVRMRRGRVQFGYEGVNSHGPPGTFRLWGRDAVAFDQAAPAAVLGA